MYTAIYEMLANYLFGGAVANTSYEHLVAVLITSIICIAVVVIPFTIVSWIFRW